MPLTCDICGKSAIPDDEIVHFENQQICQGCKDGFFQRMREGVAPNAPGMMRRIGVLGLHLAWTVFSAYIVLILFNWGMIVAFRSGAPADALKDSPLGTLKGLAWFLVMFVLDPAVSACAAILTVRAAIRQLEIKPGAVLKQLAPPLLIILVATGIPAALICGILVFAMFIGFILALLLTPYFLTIIFALAYLLWLKWRAR